MKRLIVLGLALGFTSLINSKTHAQEVSVPTVTTADPGQLFPNDPLVRSTDPYLNPRGPTKQQGAARKARAIHGQSAQARQDRLERLAAQLRPEYDLRVRRDGKESASRWLRAKAYAIGEADGRAAKAAR